MKSETRRVRCEPLGTIITLPEKPERIVSLFAGYVEALWELGLKERVAGVSAFCGR